MGMHALLGVWNKRKVEVVNQNSDGRTNNFKSNKFLIFFHHVICGFQRLTILTFLAFSPSCDF